MSTNQQIKSKEGFIRNSLTTNSIKQFWKGTDEVRIRNDRDYAGFTLDDLKGSFKGQVYEDDINVIEGRVALLQGLGKNSNSMKDGANTTSIADITDPIDITLNSTSSFAIAVASQGGNPRYLYEEHKLKEFFQCLAKNGIEVNFKIIRKNT
jgi:hypothetical protein